MPHWVDIVTISLCLAPFKKVYLEATVPISYYNMMLTRPLSSYHPHYFILGPNTLSHGEGGVLMIYASSRPKKSTYLLPITDQKNKKQKNARIKPS